MLLFATSVFFVVVSSFLYHKIMEILTWYKQITKKRASSVAVASKTRKISKSDLVNNRVNESTKQIDEEAVK